MHTAFTFVLIELNGRSRLVDACSQGILTQLLLSYLTDETVICQLFLCSNKAEIVSDGGNQTLSDVVTVRQASVVRACGAKEKLTEEIWRPRKVLQ